MASSTPIAPDLNAVTPLADYITAHAHKSADIETLAEQAEQFLSGFRWLSGIAERHVGALFPGIVGIFLFRIEPAKAEVDDWTWVIVGDVPPAYITCEDAALPWEALDGYIGALDEWIAAVRAGESVSSLIPVNGAPTEANARALETRLRFLDEKIMPQLRPTA